MNRKVSLAIGALALGVAFVPAAAFAQYANDPFFEHTVPLSQAHGLESIGLRLDLASTFQAPLDEELIETIEGVTGAAYERFAATLKMRDPELGKALLEALDEVGEAVEEGADPTEAIAEARDLLAKAYDVVVPAELREQPAFKGAVMINLLLAEEGVAEGYEEAVEGNEPWEYPNGWVALQRVKALWEEVKSLATPERLADGQEMIALLDTLYPQAQPPESVAGWNPEEAEAPAQRLGGIIEEVTSANLYPGRDFVRLAGHLADVTASACQAYEAEPGAALESIVAVYDLYAAHLEGTAGMFAPEAQAEASELFAQMISVEDDDDDEDAGETGGEVEDEDDDAAGAAPAPAGDLCSELQKAFTEMKSAIGG